MTTHAHERRLLTISEAAAELRYSESTIRRLINADRIPAVQLGGPRTAIRVDALALARMLAPNEETT